MEEERNISGTVLGTIRINKYIADAGVCSRREADRLIEAGRVRVNGVLAAAGERVEPGAVVTVDNKTLSPEAEEVFLLFHKPIGIVCTAEKREKDNVIDFIDYPIRIYPIGRLDKDSHGLLLLTNQGEMANEILKAKNLHEKEYIVKVDKDVTEGFLKRMAGGIYLEELDKTTAPCKVKKLANRTFSVILIQGLNRQIRRMCEAEGYRVVDLMRIRVMDFTLEGIPEGKYRKLSKAEIRALKQRLLQSQIPSANTKYERYGIGYGRT